MKSFEQLIKDLTRKAGILSDITDPRFQSPRAKNPVEYETARMLYSLVRSMKAHTIVETGTNIGLSSIAMAKALTDDDLPGAHLYTYDITDFGVPKYVKHLGLARRLTFFQQSSLESDLIGKIAKIDLLFLDSLTELLEAEFILFWPLLRRTSRVIIHDTRLYAGKSQAINNILAKYGWTEISFSAGRGISILSPGVNGLVAQPQPIRYAVIFDARESNGLLSLEGWPISDKPERVWLVGSSEITNKLFPSQGIEHAGSIQDSFRQALQTQLDYILFVNCSVDSLDQHISRLWNQLRKASETLDYIAPDGLPYVDMHSGGLELQQISQRWITDKTVIRTPQVSPLLFLINARLLRETGGFIDVPGNEHWSFSATVARLSLANGVCYPMIDFPSGRRWLFPVNCFTQTGSDGLRSALSFYRYMPRNIRVTYLERWNRLVRIYYYGLVEEGRLWPNLFSKPLSLKDWWQIIFSRYLF